MSSKGRGGGGMRRNPSGGGGGGMGSMGGMGGMGGGMGGMLAQVQKLQEDMMAAQEALKSEMVEASVGGGVVTVRMSASGELHSIQLQPDVVDPDDVEMLQDLLVAAFNEAQAKGQTLTEERMAPFTSMLGGLSGGLF